MNPEQIAAKWNALTPAARLRVIKTDPSMRHPTWAALAERMSASTFEQLTRLQQDAVLTDLARFL